jgi:hypothetical protein
MSQKEEATESVPLASREPPDFPNPSYREWLTHTHTDTHRHTQTHTHKHTFFPPKNTRMHLHHTPRVSFTSHSHTHVHTGAGRRRSLWF